MKILKPSFLIILSTKLLIKTHAKSINQPILKILTRSTHIPSLKKKRLNNEKKLITSIRGGSIAKPETLAKTFSYLASIDALTGSFLPITACSWGGINIEKDSVGHIFCEAVGAHAAAFAITSYLATTGKTSIEEAIAYGHVARLILILKVVLSGKLNKLGFEKRGPLCVAAIMTFVAYNLLSDAWEPMFCAKLLAIAMIFGSVLIMFDPESMVESIVNYDIELEDRNTKDMLRGAACYLFMNGLHTTLIISGVDKIKAIGYTSLTLLPAMLYFSQMDIDKVFGLSKEVVVAVATITIGLISAGILL